MASRKKNAGALFMDFEISPDDRIGGASPRSRARAKPAPKAKKPAKSQRVEPGFADFDDGYYTDEPAPRSRGRAPAPKKNPARAKREKKGFSMWGLFGKLIYWCITLVIIGGIAAGGVVYYYWMQMPSVTTWAVPERAPNIRVVASDGQLISNRGKSGGEAVSLHELPEYVPMAFVAIEDRRFYEHFGIDVVGLASVALESIRAGDITRGASTITQQVAVLLRQVRAQSLAQRSRYPRGLAPGSVPPQSQGRSGESAGASKARPSGHGQGRLHLRR